MKTPLPSLFPLLFHGETGASVSPFLTPSIEKALSRAYGFRAIAGIDEAGRGPLAGPVVAAAVVLRMDSYPEGIRDSKRLSPRKREVLFEEITSRAVGVGVGIVGPRQIDTLNIRRATLLAMQRAVEALPVKPDFCVIDGIDEISLPLPQSSLVKGDCRCLSVAAASIIAKVVRDRMMQAYHGKYPGYGFDRNMGYGTKRHREALRRQGPCPIHRHTFRGVEVR